MFSLSSSEYCLPRLLLAFSNASKAARKAPFGRVDSLVSMPCDSLLDRLGRELVDFSGLSGWAPISTCLDETVHSSSVSSFLALPPNRRCPRAGPLMLRLGIPSTPLVGDSYARLGSVGSVPCR